MILIILTKDKNMNYRTLIIAALFIMTLNFTYAEEGNEEQNRHENRFVFGIGAGGGLSLIKYTETDDPYIEPGTGSLYLHPCFSTNFRIGFAPSDKFFICWNGRSSFFKGIESGNGEKEFLVGGGAGLGISFFPTLGNDKIYFNGLFGYSNIFRGFKDFNNFGTEIAVGAGYLFSSHLSTELTIQLGTSEKSSGAGLIKNPLVINFTVNYLLR